MSQSNFSYGNSSQNQKRPFYFKPWFVMAVIIIVILLVFLTAFAPYVIIPAGHTGVVTTFGKVSDATLPEGLHIKNPIQQVILMDVRSQKTRIELQAFSSDIQQVDVVVSVNYALEKEEAPTVYQSIGTEYYQARMEPRIQECVKAVFTRYSAEKLMQVRDTLSTQISDLLTPEMEAIGVRVDSVSIENVDFTDAFTNAVEEKQVAEQTKLKVETEQSQQVSVERSAAERQIIAAKAAAEEKTILAEAEATVAKIKADAAAYTKQVEADAEAEANEKLAKSITEQLIEYVKANNWDGKLPEYVGGDTTVPILDMRGASAD